MLDKQGPTLKGDEIRATLSRADEMALESGASLELIHEDWLRDIDFLSSDDCPVTYLPVLTVMLVARSIRSKNEIDVLDIQRGTSARGYSAPSIAGHLIKFVNQIGVDLRSNSSQVMNNQPFTYKHRVISNMAGDRYRSAYARFFQMAEKVEELESEVAHSLLALILHLRRGAGVATGETLTFTGGRAALESMSRDAAEFVSENSESGKVGQAFAAALFDLIFPTGEVRMGNNNNSSAVIPGDVQVGNRGTFWMWAEVKQRAVVTSEVQAFIDRVKEIGGDRVMYFALKNSPYPHNINELLLQRRANKDGIQLTIYSAPEQALEDLLAKSPGNSTTIAEDFANGFIRRLHEAQVTSRLEQKYMEVLRTHFESQK
jgi:hypothetical protein